MNIDLLSRDNLLKISKLNLELFDITILQS